MRGGADLDRALAAILATRPDAVLSFSDVATYLGARRIGEVVTRHQLPWMSSFREITAEGGLLSYGPSTVGLQSHSATFVAKILGGAKPAAIPVEQPTAFELIVNLRSAKALGLSIAPALLLRADHVIE